MKTNSKAKIKSNPKATKKTKTISNFLGFSYLVAVNVPIKSTRAGDVIIIDPAEMERVAAIAIVSNRVPLHGKEVGFLRKVFGLSCEKFAREFGLSPSTVLRWEQAAEDRLALPNEIAVRMFFAEKLGVELSNKFSALIGLAQTGKIELKLAA